MGGEVTQESYRLQASKIESDHCRDQANQVVAEVERK